MRRHEDGRGSSVIWVILALGAVALLVGIGLRSRPLAAPGIETERHTPPMQKFHDPFEEAIDLQDLAGSRERLLRLSAEASRETLHETQALLARLHAVEGDFESAQRDLEALKSELDGDSRAAAVRYLLERGRAYARAEEKRATRAHVEDAWYLARELNRGDLEFEAALLAAWSGELDERELWKKRMREALESSAEARALAERRKEQLTTFVATDDYAVTYCLALR